MQATDLMSLWPVKLEPSKIKQRSFPSGFAPGETTRSLWEIWIKVLHIREQHFRWGVFSGTSIWRWSRFICLPSNTPEKKMQTNINHLLHFNTLKCRWIGATGSNSYPLHQWFKCLLRDIGQTTCETLQPQGLSLPTSREMLIPRWWNWPLGEKRGRKGGWLSKWAAAPTDSCLDAHCPPEGKALVSRWLRNTAGAKPGLKIL